MKRVLSVLMLVLLSVMCFGGGYKNTVDENKVKMTAVVQNLGEKIEVEVVQSEYTSGVHWVITSEDTQFCDSEGSQLCKEDLKVGDKVEILYNGQVMLSFPPQIVAHKITVLN